MSQPTVKSETTPDAKLMVEIVRIAEKYYTIRLIGVLSAVVLIVGFLCFAFVKVVQRPWWEAMCATICAALGIGGGGNYLILRKVRKRIKKIHLPVTLKGMLTEEKK